MKKIQQYFFEFSLKNFFLFCFIWLFVGFSSGTLLLLYPVHWISDYSEANKWQNSTENILIKIVIILFVVLSFCWSVRLLQAFLRKNSTKSKTIFSAVLIFITAFFLWLWMNPDIMSRATKQNIASENTKNAEFFFGSYPSESKLYDLKEDGYTLVVSLLHPAVIPFETKLISDEEKSVAKVGIKYIHVPMLPWVSDNIDAINKIKEIVKNEKGKIFIHCYLGKDRVNVVKNIIKNNNGVIEKSMDDESRKIDKISKFERGDIIKLDPDVYFIPYPTEEEYFGFILTSPIKQVVSLLNPENKDDSELIESEKKLLLQYKINYHLMPLITEPYNPDSVLKIIQQIKKIPQPVVIHGFFTKGALGEAILLTYKTQKQALPPSLFSTPMKKGTVTIISANTVAGNSPSGDEFKSFLFYRGVRNIAFTGDSKSTAAISLQNQAKKAGMEWRNFNLNDKALTEALKTGGTWYVFGSPIEEIQEAMAGKLQ